MHPFLFRLDHHSTLPPWEQNIDNPRTKVISTSSPFEMIPSASKWRGEGGNGESRAKSTCESPRIDSYWHGHLNTIETPDEDNYPVE